MCNCIICTLKDNPKLLLKVLKEQLAIYEYYLEVFKHHKIKSGSLGYNPYTYSSARCITEENIEEINTLIIELEDELNVHNTKST